MNVLLAYMCNHVHAWCLWRSDKDIRSSATGITDSCESPCECWELKPGLPHLCKKPQCFKPLSQLSRGPRPDSQHDSSHPANSIPRIASSGLWPRGHRQTHVYMQTKHSEHMEKKKKPNDMLTGRRLRQELSLSPSLVRVTTSPIQ